MIAKQSEAISHISELRDKISAIVGNVKIGENASTASLKKYLYDELELPIVKRTDTNQASIDDEALILLREYCKVQRPELVQLFDLVQDYRRWQKIKSTYIDGYMKYINDATGRIHADLLPLATDTGRFACRNPNLQNCPRSDNDEIGVRNFFTADEGNVLLSFDFSQIELHVGAFYCRDEMMLDTYRTGGDIHGLTTAVIYHIPFDEAVDKSAPLYKERRTIAKNCNFGTFFGLFPKGLQNTLNFKAGLDTSLTECEQIIDNLKHGYPKLAEWQDTVKSQAKDRHYSDKIDETIVFIKSCMEAQPFPEFDIPIIAETAVGSRFGELHEI